MSDELADLMKSINKRYGDACFVQASKSEKLGTRRRIETGIMSFDLALGGGVPMGTIITLKGEFSSGKSALAHRIGAAFQRTCRNCGNPRVLWNEITQDGAEVSCCEDPKPMRVVWFDAEGSYQNQWAERLGMNSDNTYVIRTEFAEQGIDVADAVIRSGECDLLVVDSVAALTPSVEIEESSEKWQVGVHARLMNKAMRKWVSAQNAVGMSRVVPPTILLINQIRMKIGVMYGSPETSPGGKGLDFAASVICKVKRKGFMEDKSGAAPFGQDMEIVVQKNKTAPPNRSCLFSLYFRDSGVYSAGASNLADQIVAIGEYWGLVEKAGSWFKLPNGEKYQGTLKTAEALAADELLLFDIKDKIWSREVDWMGDTDED
jgi:recombination protein RecA